MTRSADPQVDVRRAAGRYRTRSAGVESRHSFSFGAHYDADNTHHGLLIAHNEERIDVGAGFDTHTHQDLEIVTWVLRGSLRHRDSAGHSGAVYPGLAQRMSAGAGISHSERNDACIGEAGRPGEPLHLVQMWVVPDESGREPGYEQRDIGADLDRGGLVTVASGRRGHDAAIGLGSSQAALHASRLSAGGSVEVPEAPYLHLFVASGEVRVEGVGALSAGDAVRFTAAGARLVTASAAAEILLWEMHATD